MIMKQRVTAGKMEKKPWRFLWDSGMLLLFLSRRRRGDKCPIEDLWEGVCAVRGSPEQLVYCEHPSYRSRNVDVKKWLNKVLLA